MTTKNLSPTDRTKLGRIPQRGVYDCETIYQILDEAPYCQLAVSLQGNPVVLPTMHTRIDNKLYIHGAKENRLLNHIAQGAQACISATLLDGLVLAKSGLHHSMNFRSVVIYSTGIEITDPKLKTKALETLVNQIVPQRWNDSRPPTDAELKVTKVIEFSLEEASAKVRTGPPMDDKRDQELPYWSGNIPLKLVWETPVPDATSDGIPLPAYLSRPHESLGKKWQASA
jgi:uncharacterized protein